MGRVKTRFLRALVEFIQQETRGTALARLKRGLPPHLLPVLARDLLGTQERNATIDLDLGLELLVTVDTVLCGGSGLITMQSASAIVSRVLSHSSGLVVPGDTLRTLQHLRAPFEQPFLDTEARFSARATADGLVLELALVGHPRAGRWLSAMGMGYAHAAAKFSGNDFSSARLASELFDDSARILARQGDAASAPAAANNEAPPTPRPASVRRRSSPTNAAARVNQILSRTASAASGIRPAAGAPAASRTRKSAS
jgi:hypothetical protein